MLLIIEKPVDHKSRDAIYRVSDQNVIKKFSAQSVCGFGLSERVKHATFGEGVITGFEGQGDNALIQVKFARAGSKWLTQLYAKLEKI